MTSVNWRLTEMLDAGHTFGYITKNGRIGLGLEKTDYNNAFCITGGNTGTDGADLLRAALAKQPQIQ